MSPSLVRAGFNTKGSAEGRILGLDHALNGSYRRQLKGLEVEAGTPRTQPGVRDWG
jgi:hypothetical protein